MKNSKQVAEQLWLFDSLHAATVSLEGSGNLQKVDCDDGVPMKQRKKAAKQRERQQRRRRVRAEKGGP